MQKLFHCLSYIAVTDFIIILSEMKVKTIWSHKIKFRFFEEKLIITYDIDTITIVVALSI